MPFITNASQKNLAKRIGELIKRSGEIKFLVGFFYFSGFEELYEVFKQLDREGKFKQEFLKILVGLNVDDGINGLYEYSKHSKIYNQTKSKEQYFESLRKAFNSADTDKREFYEQYEFFLKLLEENKIVLKKTKEPNHSKLYLFKLRDEIISSLFITGSSNLTCAGLTYQREFNVEIRDYGQEEAEKYFDELWEKAISFDSTDKEKIKEILTEETFFKKVSPFTVWVYLLKLYLDLYSETKEEEREKVKSILKKAGYTPYNYQIEAVLQAFKMCEFHSGVLIADVVGLGKTIIACATARMLKEKRGVVIAPPHLIGDENKSYGWKKYVEDFQLYGWEVRSLGKLDDVLEFVREHNDIEVVIVDEAHRFRNEKTESYHLLHEICRGKKVILLTATPFNNRPSDIFALLKLFTIPKKSTIILDENLADKFNSYGDIFEKLSYIKNHYNSTDSKKNKRAQEYYKKIFNTKNVDINRVHSEAQKLARTIRGIIEPVTIRRNRLDLKYYGEEIAVSKINDPEEWFFELTEEQSEFYDEVINTFCKVEEGGRFSGAIYTPIKYARGFLDDDAFEKLPAEDSFKYTFQSNLYDYMRRLLVKRFESSFGAFEESLKYFIDIHNVALEFINKTQKFILDRKCMSDIIHDEDDDKIDERLEEYKNKLREQKIHSKFYDVYEINNFKFKEKFIKDIQSDKELFEELLDRFNELKLKEDDPKIKKLISGVKKYLNERKIVIFTEYIATAKYLQEALKEEFSDILLPAFGDFTNNVLDAIYRNFDAQNKNQENKFHILLASDKLSEGFNLNRAGVVINYDIPWNPVRVIQRVGRINRIAKKVYDEIFIVNFFPTQQGADVVKSREIATNKMFMIHKVLGEDAKIFSPDEEPQPANLYRRLTQYVDEEVESFFSKVRADYENIQKKYPDIIAKLDKMPFRVKIALKGSDNELYTFFKKGDDMFVAYKNYNEKEPIVVAFDEIYDKIKIVDKDEPLLPLSDNFWQNYQQIAEKEFAKLSKTGSRDIANQARNLLKSLQNIDEFEKMKSFIGNLIDDIDLFGTLSDYILSEIVGWNEYYIKNNFSKIIEELEKLKQNIGEDFLEKAQKYMKKQVETIIIALEHIKENKNVTD